MCEGSQPLKRRTFLEGMFVAGAVAASSGYLWHNRPGLSPRQSAELAGLPERHMSKQQIAERVHLEIARDEVGMSLDGMLRSAKPDLKLEHLEQLAQEMQDQRQVERYYRTLSQAKNAAAQRVEEGIGLAAAEPEAPGQPALPDDFDGSYFDRVRFFDNNFPDDKHLSDPEWDMLLAVSHRIEAVRDYVGYGNFNIISWDDMLAYARNVSDIGAFNEAELAFLESLFYADARELGFYGERTGESIGGRINRDAVVKVPRTGHFLLRGESEALYNRLRGDLGDALVLTSGVRGIPKQFDLFLAKTRQTEGNLSRASRSLAPPGYSYHSVGDFDVGKYGLGLGNFTEDFAETEIFRELRSLGYTDIRYTADNQFGVRFEPWHVRIG